MTIPTPNDAVGRLLEAATTDPQQLPIYVDAALLPAILRVLGAHRTLRAAERARERERAMYDAVPEAITGAPAHRWYMEARIEVTEAWQALEELALAGERELNGADDENG